MLFKNVAGLTALSALTKGFLIPPQVSKADLDTVKTLPFAIAPDGISTTVELKCAGCPVPAVNIDGSAIQHVDSKLELQYVVEHNPNAPDRLLVNGVSIFPANIASLEPFKASQKFPDDQPFQTMKGVPLGYEMTQEVASKDVSDLELIDINVQIFEVADKFVDGIDAVQVQLIKAPTGALMITSIELKPSTSVGTVVDDKDCTSVVCKWRAILAAKLAHLKPLRKGCHGGKSKAQGGKAAASTDKETGSRPHHNGEDPKGDDRHHRHHGFVKAMHALKKIATHIFIPIFIGIAAGLTASVIGTALGQLIVLAWRSIRGKRAAYFLLANDEDVVDKKIPSVEPQGPPPVYEDTVVVENAADEKN